MNDSPSPSPRARVLFPHIVISSFIRKDIDLLSEQFEVVTVDCSRIHKILWNLPAIWSADAVYCWFGSLRFLPLVILGRLLSRPVIVIAGGYDVARVESIGYGNMCNPISRFLGRLLFRLANVVVAVSQLSHAEAEQNALVPRGKLCLIPLGFDPDVERRHFDVPKEDLVCTLGVGNISSIRRKGILTVVRVSRLLPQIPFVIAGRCEEAALAELRSVAGANVTFLGEISESERLKLLARARIYMQPSLHEAFGCSVAEAMLQDCIPIVSNLGALPEVVGQAGCYAPFDDCDALVACVRDVLDAKATLLEAPRQRIVREFPLSARRVALLKLVQDVVRKPNRPDPNGPVGDPKLL